MKNKHKKGNSIICSGNVGDVCWILYPKKNMPTSWHTGSNIQTDDAYSREEKRKASQPNANLKIKCKSVNYQSRKRCISLELRQMGKGNQNSIVCFETHTHKKKQQQQISSICLYRSPVSVVVGSFDFIWCEHKQKKPNEKPSRTMHQPFIQWFRSKNQSNELLDTSTHAVQTGWHEGKGETENNNTDVILICINHFHSSMCGIVAIFFLVQLFFTWQIRSRNL